MSHIDHERDPEPPPRRGAAIPYLHVEGARDAIAWYGSVFGARVTTEPILMADDRIGHCELEIDDAVVYVSEQFPEIGVVAPTSGATAVSLMLAVDDADETLQRAESAGGRRDREPENAHGERLAWLIDPFGHRWGISSPLR